MKHGPHAMMILVIETRLLFLFLCFWTFFPKFTRNVKRLLSIRAKILCYKSFDDPYVIYSAYRISIMSTQQISTRRLNVGCFKKYFVLSSMKIQVTPDD